MRAAILHLRDARVGVMRMPSLRVATFLRALPIMTHQVGPRRPACRLRGVCVTTEASPNLTSGVDGLSRPMSARGLQT
jgi:hypothetical protein